MSTEYSIKKSWFGGYKVSYDCPHCSTALTSPLDDAGKTDYCPECNKQLVVPGKDARARMRSEERRAEEVARDAKKWQSKAGESRELRTATGYPTQTEQAGARPNLESPDNWLPDPAVKAKPNHEQY